MKACSHNRNRENQRGQVIILLAVSMLVLLLFAGLAIDVAFAYVTRARLGKAVDAACLTGMKNLYQGQTTARTLALNAFNANYQPVGDLPGSPVVVVNFPVVAGQTQIGVTATSTIKTVFMGIIPKAATLTVGDTAQALRGTLVMSLVLDRSGSMANNGGWSALKSAVPLFVADFVSTDYMAMISFASNATTDVAMTNVNVISTITSTVNGWNQSTFTGATFGPGGLTLAKTQEDNTNPPNNVVKVVVYFTDGFVNTIQDTFQCTNSLGATLYNYGGYDPNTQDPSCDNMYDFLNPTNGTDISTTYGHVDGCSSPYGWGLDTHTPPYPPYNASKDCAGVTTFKSQIDGTQKTFSRTNITADAKYRALQTAKAMLSENPGITIYSVGLGHAVDTLFLQEIANDPAAGTGNYNPNLPEGLAVFAPDCPGATCTQELNTVFQTIASKILLRLTQ